MFRLRLAAASMLLVLALSACGGGGGNAQNPPPPTPTGGPTPVTVSGVAGKGLLLNAIVNFYAVTNGTVSTTSLANARTNATTGAFSASVASSDPVVVIVTVDANTQMLDEISGTAGPAPTGLTLRTALPSLTNLQPIAVTPLTEMAVGIASAATGGLTTANINAATTAVNTAFLGGASSLNTQPIDVKDYKNAPVAQQQLSKLLVALAVAANQGIATNASGAACDSNVGDYNARLVCMVGGLSGLLHLGAGNAGTLQTNANYIAAAYTQINEGNVTVAGGQAPSALGLDTATQAETAFRTAVATQAPLPGYDPGASPLANTKALFADIRTNILDQSDSQTFGLAPVGAAIGDDFKTNVRPVLQNGGAALGAMKMAADLLVASHTDPASGDLANLSAPIGVALASNGDLYVSGGFSHVLLRITQSGTVTSVAGLSGVTGSDDGTGTAARFSNPRGLAIDSAGNVFVADQSNHTIRKVTPAGVVTTLAGHAGTPGNTNGTGTAALFNNPFGLGIDASGNLYVSELGNPTTVRKVTPDGTVTTFATAVANLATGVAVDPAGNVYVADFAAPRIRKITPAGVVSTLAGAGVPAGADGVGLQAGFRGPFGVATDAAGNVFVADTGNNKIRLVTSGGLVITIAGQTEIPGNEDGTGAAAHFRGPNALVAAPGTLFVADGGNNSIRKIVTGAVVSTVAHGAASYRASGGTVCGYDPPRLSPGQNNVAACRYGGVSDPILMTVAETGAGTYHITTQPLTGTFNPAPPIGTTPVFLTYTRSTTIPALDASFTIASGTGNALTATANGPLYVTATGGQITAAVSLAAGDGWDLNTSTGTLTLSGTFSGGSGGISLTNATLGPDSSLVLTNLGVLEGVTLPPGSAIPSAHGSLAVTDATTSAFVYSAKFSVGTPVTDKSGTAGIPSVVSLSGSVAAVGAGGSKSPIFTGDISLALSDIPSFDITLPPSSSNTLTAQLQINGKLVLTGGRELSLLATTSAKEWPPTPEKKASLMVTYSYVTPKGTALLNLTSQFDPTNGITATLTNNAGVTANLTKLPGGSDTPLTGTVTANGQQTATITGSTINYSDGTSESLL